MTDRSIQSKPTAKLRYERRRYPRHFVRQTGVMIDADGSVLGSCLMVDVSAGGAHLRVKAPNALPNQFTLLLSQYGQLRRHCCVVWQKENVIGVHFVHSTPIKEK